MGKIFQSCQKLEVLAGIMLFLLPLWAGAQTQIRQDPTEASSKLVYHIPPDVFERLEKKYDARIALEGFFVDSLDGRLDIGISIYNDSIMKSKCLLIDSSGAVRKEWQWSNDKAIAHTSSDAFDYRSLDSSIYYAADGQLCFLLGDSQRVVDNPWFPANAKRLFPWVPLDYVREEGPDPNSLFPLFRITRSYIYSATQDGMVYVYKRSTHKLLRKIRLKFPAGYKDFNEYYFFYCAADPVVCVLGDSVLLWDGGIFFYDAKEGRFFDPPPRTGFAHFAGSKIGYIKHDGLDDGECYFVLGDDVYRFFYTNGGLFVFVFKI